MTASNLVIDQPVYCAGQNKVDMDKMEWKYVAKGTCKTMNGLSIEEAKKLKV